MKQESKEKFAHFMKTRGYLVILAVCCVAAVVVTAIALGNGGANSVIERPHASVIPSVSQTVSPSVEPSVEPTTGPVATVIVFDSPVLSGTVGMTFSEDELCFSQTLGYWYGHMGIDFLGEVGQDCLAVYGGRVESITRDIASGTVITIRINDALTVSYGSLAEETAVEVGDTVVKGQKIGTISDTAYDEFKEGPHVHLCVYENGVKVNPEKYLQTQEK